jgi:hypothetical protein
LERDLQSLGDPKSGCSLTARGPAARCTPTASFRKFVTAIHPHIKRVTQRDGSGREWLKNSLAGDRIVLTSGKELNFIGGRCGPGGEKSCASMPIKPARPVGALTTDQQPYAVDESVNWSLGVGGQGGNFVQIGASGAALLNAARQTTSAPTPPTPPTSPTTNAANGPPASTSGARNAGAEIGGRVICGGLAGEVGGASGPLLGGGYKQQPQPSNTTQNCPC